MKKLFVLLLFSLGVTSSVCAQIGTPRVMSYTQWMDEMVACEDSTYILTNAIIRPNLSTDTITRDQQLVTANVLLTHVEFEGYSEVDQRHKPESWSMNVAAVHNLTFQNDFTIQQSKGVVPQFSTCKFHGNLMFEAIESPQSDLIFFNIECAGLATFTDIRTQQFYFRENLVYGALSLENIDFNYFYFDRDTIYGPVILDGSKGKYFQMSRSQLQIQHPDLDRQESPMAITGCDIEDVRIRQNKILKTADDQFIKIEENIVAYYFAIWQCEVQPMTILRTLHLSNGRLLLGEDNDWSEGISFYTVEYNKFSYFNWPSLRGKVFTYNDPRKSGADVKLYKGETFDELENEELFHRLILAKKQILNNFLESGFRTYGNELLIEIRDLETRMWEHKYQKDGTIDSYFHWKMNLFLKKFSAYGTNPVIAISYSLNVILYFGLFYLFFHNAWDIGSRKVIGQRLSFMLKYFLVPKGLSELYQESQVETHEHIAKLNTDNEKSIRTKPRYFTRVVRWYITSNLVSERLKKHALKNVDILSGTYAKLSKHKKRRVAFISGSWLFLFLTYTLLAKLLNALTLSLNAFTTLGFGNIPTQGISRYVVIVEGFIGWVLMTIFSVTLISQLIQ